MNVHITEETKLFTDLSKHSIRNYFTFKKICILSEPDHKINIDQCKNIISNISYKQFEIYLEYIKNNNLEKGIEIYQI